MGFKLEIGKQYRTVGGEPALVVCRINEGIEDAYYKFAVRLGEPGDERFEEYTEAGKFFSWDESEPRDIERPPCIEVVVLRCTRRAGDGTVVYEVVPERAPGFVAARAAALGSLGYNVEVLGKLEDYDA